MDSGEELEIERFRGTSTRLRQKRPFVIDREGREGYPKKQ